MQYRNALNWPLKCKSELQLGTDNHCL